MGDEGRSGEKETENCSVSTLVRGVRGRIYSEESYWKELLESYLYHGVKYENIGGH